MIGTNEKTEMQPWLDDNGDVLSNTVLKQIAKLWDEKTWELFLHTTVEAGQQHSLLGADTCDSLDVRAVSTRSEKYDEPAELKAMIEKIPRALQRLTTQQKKIIEYLFWAGLSIRETAKVLGVSRTLVSIQKQNSFKKIRQLLNADRSGVSIGKRFGQSERPDMVKAREEDIREVYLSDLKGSYIK